MGGDFADLSPGVEQQQNFLRQLAGFPEVLRSGPRCPRVLSPSAHRYFLRSLPSTCCFAWRGMSRVARDLPPPGRGGIWVCHRWANSGYCLFRCDKVLWDLPSISVEPGVSSLVAQLFICLSRRTTPPGVLWGCSQIRRGQGGLSRAGCQAGCQGRLHRALCLVECSAVVVLKFLIIFRKGPAFSFYTK